MQLAHTEDEKKMWTETHNDRWDRPDGAAVFWSSRDLKWFAYAPGKGWRDPMKNAIDNVRYWKTAKAAMKAVDKEFPTKSLTSVAE
jgi:hypothetical protein